MVKWFLSLNVILICHVIVNSTRLKSSSPLLKHKLFFWRIHLAAFVVKLNKLMEVLEPSPYLLSGRIYWAQCPFASHNELKTFLGVALFIHKCFHKTFQIILIDRILDAIALVTILPIRTHPKFIHIGRSHNDCSRFSQPRNRCCINRRDKATQGLRNCRTLTASI